MKSTDTYSTSEVYSKYQLTEEYQKLLLFIHYSSLLQTIEKDILNGPLVDMVERSNKLILKNIYQFFQKKWTERLNNNQAGLARCLSDYILDCLKEKPSEKE